MRESAIEGVALEHLVRLGLITGLPEKVSLELQQTKDIEELLVSDILGRARVLVSNQGTDSAAVGAQSNYIRGLGQSHQGYKGLKGYECGGLHMVRLCPSKQKDQKFKCYKCGLTWPEIVKELNKRNQRINATDVQVVV